jgi:hypothetical protein
MRELWLWSLRYVLSMAKDELQIASTASEPYCPLTKSKNVVAKF